METHKQTKAALCCPSCAGRRCVSFCLLLKTHTHRFIDQVEAEGLILFHISLHTLSSFASCEGNRASLQLRDECTLIVLHNYTNQLTSSFMQDHNKWGKIYGRKKQVSA